MKLAVLAAAVVALSFEAPASASEETRSVDAAIQLTYQPDTRPDGIEILERALPAADDPDRVRLALARALSWEGRNAQALSHYDALIRSAEGESRRALVRERLQVLLWMNRVEEATRGYERLLDENPSDVGALVGLARARRWSGRPLAARALAARAVDIAPDHAEARQELAWAYVDLGLAGRAEAQAAAAGGDAPADLAARIDRARSVRLSSSAPVSTDSFGVTRAGPRVLVSAPLGGDVRVEGGGGLTYLEREGVVLQRASGAAAVTFRWPRLSLRAAGGAVDTGNGVRELLQAEGGVRLADGARLRVGAARHPFFEMTDPLASGEAAFHAAGGGGATDLAALSDTMVNEAGLGLEWSPATWMYSYADARGRAIGDGNAGASIAAGLGINLLAAVPKLDLFARWDAYAAGFRETRAAYFSPLRFDSHGAGGELAWQVGSSLRLRGEGGVTFALLERAPIGYFAGGGASLRAGPLDLQVRLATREDPYFASTRGWLSLAIAL